jgi:hypothetical protein
MLLVTVNIRPAIIRGCWRTRGRVEHAPSGGVGGLVRLAVMKVSSFRVPLIAAVAVHDVEQGPAVKEPAEVLGEEAPDRLG